MEATKSTSHFQYEKSKNFWLNLIDDFSLSCFPYDKESSELKYSKEHQVIPKDISDKLLSMSNNSDFRLYILLASVVSFLLSKYTNSNSVIIGSSIGKDNSSKKVDFINTILPYRISLHEEKSFKDLILDIKDIVFSSIENQNYPISNLFNELNDNVNGNDINKLFDVAVTLDAIHDMSLVLPQNPNMIFDFSVKDKLIHCKVEYNQSLYKPNTVKKIFSNLVKVSKLAFDDVNICIKDIQFADKKEMNEIFDAWGKISENPSSTDCLNDMLLKSKDSFPGNIAINDNGKLITYAEFYQKAFLIATELRNRGVSSNNPVGILLPHSADIIVSIIAVLLAGCAYLPLDKDLPKERINFYLKDTDCKLIISNSGIIENSNLTIDVLNLDVDIHNGHPSSIYNKNSDNDIAYIIYTSGTSGRPKGVLIEQGNLMNYLKWAIQFYDAHQKGNMPFFTSFSFDLTVTSIFIPLLTGNTIFIKDAVNIKETLQSIFSDGSIDIVKLTPSHLKLCEKDQRWNSSKKVILGGEELESSLVAGFSESNPEATFFNEYGPTETTVGSSIYIYDSSTANKSTLPIGKTVENTRIYIMDNAKQHVPIGCKGEIYIAGNGLARGYINNPELTHDKFIVDKSPGQLRMYKTGDYGRNIDGNMLEYLGRIDDQVKVKGYRIELNEIEYYVNKFEGISNSVAVIDTKASQENYIGALYEGQSQIDILDLKKYLSEHIPVYMLPTMFKKVDHIPLASSGKIDRKKSITLFRSIEDTIVRIEPGNETQKEIYDIWKEVLGNNEFGINENFFALGGDSMKSLIIINKINDQFKLELDIINLYQNETVERLAEFVESKKEKQDISSNRSNEILKQMEEMKNNYINSID